MHPDSLGIESLMRPETAVPNTIIESTFQQTKIYDIN